MYICIYTCICISKTFVVGIQKPLHTWVILVTVKHLCGNLRWPETNGCLRWPETNIFSWIARGARARAKSALSPPSSKHLQNRFCFVLADQKLWC